MLITHFANPQVINVDDVNSKVEATIDFVPIPVHAVYTCDIPIQMKCVNTTPLDDNASYQIQDLSGGVLTSQDIVTIFDDVLPHMRHAEVLKDFQKKLEERTQFHLGYPYNLDFDYSALEPLQQFSINNLGDPSSGRAMKPSLSVGSWHVSAVLLT